MSRLQIAGLTLAVLIGMAHGFLAVVWELTVDQKRA